MGDMLSNSNNSTKQLGKIVNNAELNINYYNRDFIVDAELFGINNKNKDKQIQLLEEANDIIKMQKLYNKNYINYETYTFGPFDSIYNHEISLKDISSQDETIKDLKDKLKNTGQNVCFIGNGQSGTGKTSFLLGFTAGGNLNRGLVDYLIKLEDIKQVRIGEVYLDLKEKPKTIIKIIEKGTLIELADLESNPD